MRKAIHSLFFTPVGTVISCVVQLFWFSRTSLNDIDMDGIDYVGIARYIRGGNFHGSLDAFRSPLISWLIATFPLNNLLLAGKLISIGTFLASVSLVYWFTY